jgi:hypothetical protein
MNYSNKKCIECNGNLITEKYQKNCEFYIEHICLDCGFSKMSLYTNESDNTNFNNLSGTNKSIKQYVDYGIQQAYLTGNPQLTFFKYIYRNSF